METLERIFQLINEKGIEQKQLAEYLGVQPQLITEWKAGRKKSYKKYIDKIADFFGVSTDYLLGKDDIKKRSTPESIERINAYRTNYPEFDKFVKIYLSLPEEKQRQVEEYAQLLHQAGLLHGKKED